MVERKAFPANPKHQYCASQCEGHDCGANNKNNGDYYAYPSLFISRIIIDYKENGEEKIFSYQIKASISCILKWRP